MMRNRNNRRQINRDARNARFKIIMICFILSVLIVIISPIITNGHYLVIPYVPIVIGVVTLINRIKNKK